ncbi:MAG: shikimate dehydrogenase, partial [Lachnospiraceae bacterium]|nr:shikimate dehydrogenase [Lachnospiraceae bacterium]
MPDINGQTAVYGIIGNPIGHTLSPVIHNTISEKLGINSVYVPFVANDDLKSIVRGLYSLGVKGINVTVPYKTDIISELTGVDSFACGIGAVNTLKYTENGYYGYNTDILGLERELEDVGISLEGRNVVLLGAGGAARAVAFMCVSKSPASVTIVNR